MRLSVLTSPAFAQLSVFVAMVGVSACLRSEAPTAVSTSNSSFSGTAKDEKAAAPAEIPAPVATTAAGTRAAGSFAAPPRAPLADIAPAASAAPMGASAPRPTAHMAPSLGALGGGLGRAFASEPAPYEGAFSAGPIRAGEWDDNANYREFTRYLGTQERLPIHRVDVSDRRFLVVRDRDGKPVPRCRVAVSDGQQHTTTLTTMASGRAILFPHAEGLYGRSLSATASCPGVSEPATRSFALDDQDGAVDLRLSAERVIPESRPVDIAFILDTTGSMGEEIDAVRSTIAKVASTLGHENFRVRLALVEYKDRGDVFVTKVHPFSASSERFLADVAKVTASGGGDIPESVNEGLHVGLTGLEWGQDSVARFAFLIGDAPPHLDYQNDADYAVEMKRASHEGVQLFTVAASGMDALGQAVFRQVAEYTGATNLFVLRGGAGPQSTGAGDPHSSCGGTQTDYSSGNLDGLIVGKIRHELRSMDGDAMRIAGLYKDENAKACNERVALND
jgi:von Willebrand factor type A domain